MLSLTAIGVLLGLVIEQWVDAFDARRQELRATVPIGGPID